MPNLAGYSDDMLLGWENGQLACSANISESPEGYIMGTDASAGRPEHALATLSPGETYRIDVYYYIEGTDPDSSDYLYKNEGTLHVGLFAVLDGGAA